MAGSLRGAPYRLARAGPRVGDRGQKQPVARGHYLGGDAEYAGDPRRDGPSRRRVDGMRGPDPATHPRRYPGKADLRHPRRGGLERLAAPARLAAGGADQLYRDTGAGVSQDQAPASHRLVVGMGHHDEDPRRILHHRQDSARGLPAASVLDLPRVVQRVPGGTARREGNRPFLASVRIVEALDDGFAEGADRRFVSAVRLLEADTDPLRVLHLRAEDVVEHRIAISAAAARP